MTTSDAEITLAEVRAIVGSRWRLILSLTIIGFAAGLIASLIIPPTYRAQVLLSAVSPDDSGGILSSIAGQVGGLAALAGVSLGGANNKSHEAIATLESRTLTEAFIRDRNLIPILFPDKRKAIQQSRLDDPKDKEFTLWDANELFKKIRTVDVNPTNGLIVLAIEWTDGAEAAQWANELVIRTNELLRSRAIERAEGNIKYLKTQQQDVTQIELKQAIARLLENEIKSVMVAKGSAEYAFRVIDAAVPPKRPIWPRKALLIAGGALAGLLISTLIAVALGKRR